MPTFARCQVLGGPRQQAQSSGHPSARREWQGAPAAALRQEDHRADSARGLDGLRDRPLRRLVRGVHSGLWPHPDPLRPQRAPFPQDARGLAPGKILLG